MERNSDQRTDLDTQRISKSATHLINKLDTYIWEINFHGEDFFSVDQALVLIKESDHLIIKLRSMLERSVCEQYKEHLLKRLKYHSKIELLEKQAYKLKYLLRRLAPTAFGNVIFI